MDSGKSGPGRVTGKGKCRGRNEFGISAYLRSRKSPVLGGKWKMKLRRTEVDKGPGTYVVGQGKELYSVSKYLQGHAHVCIG